MHSLLDIKAYDEDKDRVFQGGYNAEQIINMLGGEKDTNIIRLNESIGGGGSSYSSDGGSAPIYSDNLKSLLKDLYVPIGLFTQIKPCSTRSFSHNGDCITDGMFNELSNLTNVMYKQGGTQKQTPAGLRKTKKCKQ